MLDRHEIRKRLNGVDPFICTALAVRAAMRVLPLFCAQKDNRDAFWYWKAAERSTHLLSIMAAHRYGVYVAAKGIAINAGIGAMGAKGATAATAANAAANAAATDSSACYYIANTAVNAINTATSIANTVANADNAATTNDNAFKIFDAFGVDAAKFRSDLAQALTADLNAAATSQQISDPLKKEPAIRSGLLFFNHHCGAMASPHPSALYGRAFVLIL